MWSTVIDIFPFEWEGISNLDATRSFVFVLNQKKYLYENVLPLFTILKRFQAA